jgi:predicted Zn-dependent protease
MIGQDEAARILQKAISFKTAADMSVRLTGGEAGLARFANNEITQNLSLRDATLLVEAAFGKKTGAARTNMLDDKSLKAVVERAEVLARASEESPEYMPPLEPQAYEKIDAHFPQTAGFAPQERAEKIKEVVEPCAGAGLITSGTFASGEAFSAIANSKGLFAYHKWTSADFSITVRTVDGGGASRASQTDVRCIEDLDTRALAEKARKRALASQNPIELPPGDYTVVLEGEAVAELLYFLFSSFDARSADEGRSFMSDRTAGGNKLGQEIVGENIRIRSQPGHPLILARPFFSDGLAAREITWIEKGVAQNLSYSRYWAKQKNKRPTGRPTSLVMEGGTQSIEKLIESTLRGVLVTRLWYIRFVDPNQILLTGLTRDGTFLIENGQISKPINNFRFNESPVSLLKNVEGMSAPEKVGRTLVPAVKAHNFTFTSISSAV